MSALPRADTDPYVPMGVTDLDEVVVVENRLYPFPWTRGNFHDALRAGHSCWVLRDRQGALIAYAVMMLALDEAHLLNLSVEQRRQREGIGWRTLEWMAEVGRGHGARTMLLEVRPTNAEALRIYQRYGFERIGMRRGYYPAPGGREDAIVMRTTL